MIAGIFHQGSGLGNQLHRYVMTRVLAKEKGYKWTMGYKLDGSGKEEGFKGKFFLEQPTIVNLNESAFKRWEEKKITQNGIDIRGYDPEINFVEDNTIIDGEFQDERYFKNHLDSVDEWLRVEPLEVAENRCVIGFRGGEYAAFPDLFLTREYWRKAISMFPGFSFEVHTDDPNLAREFFPNYPVIHDVEINWRSMRYAKHAIIANSSFYILPRLLSGGTTIAPRYWARRNLGIWSLPQNYYSSFTYI